MDATQISINKPMDKDHVMYVHFPGGSDGKESTCNVGDLGSISGLGRSLEKGISAASFVNHCWVTLFEQRILWEKMSIHI